MTGFGNADVPSGRIEGSAGPTGVDPVDFHVDKLEATRVNILAFNPDAELLKSLCPNRNLIVYAGRPSGLYGSGVGPGGAELRPARAPPPGAETRLLPKE